MEAKLKLENHYGKIVWVNPTTESLRREECLCLNCARLKPELKENCHIARAFYEICKKEGVALAVTRCALFAHREWELNLYDEYFDLIKSGRKTVEGRAPFGKNDFSEIHTGDIIIFTNLNTGEQLKAITDDVAIHYPSVEEMLEEEGLENCLPGTKSIQEGIEKYYAIADYKERIQKGGIYAIRFHLTTGG